MGGIVVGGDAAILEETLHSALEVVSLFTMDEKAFGWVEGGGGSAGANDLPEREKEVVAGGAGLVVFGVRVVREWPCGAGGGVAGDGEKMGAQFVAAEEGGFAPFAIFGEEFLEHGSEAAGVEFGLMSLPEGAAEKHFAPKSEVEFENLRDGHAP